MGILDTTTLEYLDRWEAGGGVTAFSFRPARPLRHVAGQHGFLTVPGAGTRPFSLASAPEDAEVVIGTRLHSGSRFKLALQRLTPGNPVRLRGPVQRFTLDGAADDVVLVAQGVGITPFRSLLRHLAATGAPPRTRLLHVGDGHAFQVDTERLADEAHYPRDAESFRLELKRAVTDQPAATYFVSGAPAFVRETAAALTDAGISRRQIRRDTFRGY